VERRVALEAFEDGPLVGGREPEPRPVRAELGVLFELARLRASVEDEERELTVSFLGSGPERVDAGTEVPVPERHPPVGELGEVRARPWPETGADEDRWVRALHRLRPRPARRERHRAARVARLVVRPERAHGQDPVADEVAALPEGDPVVGDLGTDPPVADAELEAPARQVVERRDGFGGDEGVALGDEADAGRKLQPGRRRRGEPEGDERVERRDTGAILEFITRGRKTSRGGSPSRVIFDEAMFLKDDQIQAMVPALSAQSMNDDSSAQMIYASSAPIYESEVLHRLRKKAIDDSPPRMFLSEWSVEVDADPRDRDNWYAANPGLGVRISEEWVADQEFGVLSNEAFGIERLGIPQGGDGTAGTIPYAKWTELAIPVPARVVAVAYGLAVAPDGSWSSVGSAGRLPGGDLYVDSVKFAQGSAWVLSFLVELHERRRKAIRIDPAGSEGAFIRPLREAGVEVVEVSGREYQQACGEFLSAVEGARIRHIDQPALYTSVAAAGRREGGKEGGWVWVRPGAVDISPLKAATLALSGVERKRRPRIHVWKGEGT
jgi:hypothetical protein